MKELKRNIIKGWITTVFGVLACSIVSLLLAKKEIYFVWEGIAGYSVGAILIIAPDKVSELVSGLLGRVSNSKQQKHDEPDGE